GVGGWGGGGRAGGVPAGAAARGSSRLPRWNGHGAASRRPGRPRGVRPRWPRGRGNPEGCRRGRGGETAGGTGARWGWANPWRRRSGGCRSPVARAGRSPDGSGQGWEVAWSNLAKSWAGDQPTHYCTNVVGRSNLVSGFRDQTSCRVTVALALADAGMAVYQDDVERDEVEDVAEEVLANGEAARELGTDLGINLIPGASDLRAQETTQGAEQIGEGLRAAPRAPLDPLARGPVLDGGPR